MASKFSNLPLELKQEVFSKLDVDSSHLRSYILVCSGWKPIFQEKLYKRIMIHDFTQLSKLYETLKSNDNINDLIKRVTIKFDNKDCDTNETATIGKFFTHLSNVEHINCISGSYFKFISNALSMNRLPYLNYLIPPTTDKDMGDYITCAIMLRDRLKVLKMSERNYLDPIQNVITIENPTQFNRLFNIFNDFQSLTRLRIGKREHNIIDLIELVTNNCPSLKVLFLDVCPQIDLNNTTNNINVTPAKKLKQLSIRTSVMQHSENISYIIRKFPQLKKLETVGLERKTFHLDKFLLQKWMNYLTKIERIDLKYLPCIENEAVKLIGPTLNNLDRKCKVLVKCSYNDSTRIWDSMDLTLTPTQCQAKLFFSSLQHIKLLKDYGHLINAFILEGVNLNLLALLHPDEDLTLYQMIITQPLKYCVQLKSFLMVSCTVNDIDEESDIEVSKRKKFGTLGIGDCTLENNTTLSTIFKWFNYIEYLQLYRIRFISHPNDDMIPLRNIDMKETKIGTLSLLKQSNLNNPTMERIILVKISTEKKDCYYFYDHGSMKDSKFKPINENNYIFGRDCQDEHNAKACLIIAINCKSLKKLEVLHKRSTITCTIE